ncbi:tail fiber assembly protein [Halodesulfovibrio aestuarii]|uniref:tail fiber assembly protein n=1 Tax=Halodesulfovibrio aestuarii TaxID=126333 RepID=UPI000403B65D
MQYYYSASTHGFYRSDVHNTLPADAVTITQANHSALIAAQSQGKIIQPDENGYPVAVEPPPPPEPTEAEKAQQRITEIQSLLTANDLASVRPLRAKLAGTATDFDDNRLAELEEQAKALRAELVTLNGLV